MARDLSRLKSWLANSGIQIKNPPLFQTITALINEAEDVRESINSGAIGGSSSSGAPVGDTYLTEIDESASLSNSRRLIAGSGITLDVSVANEMTILAASGGEWSVLTNGDPVTPELVFDSDGDVIMTFTP